MLDEMLEESDSERELDDSLGCRILFFYKKLTMLFYLYPNVYIVHDILIKLCLNLYLI